VRLVVKVAESALFSKSFDTTKTLLCRLHPKFAVAHNTALIKIMWYGAFLSVAEKFMRRREFTVCVGAARDQ